MGFVEPGLFDMIMRLRSSGISEIDVLRAMETVPRSAFVPNSQKMLSYDESEIPLACGQAMLTPLGTAILCQTLDVSPKHKILHIGTGSGYTTAILAKLCKRVYSVERSLELCEQAEKNLRPLVNNAVMRHGDGRLGWRGQAPFDRILLSGSVRIMPNALLEQLSDGGRVVAVVDDMLCAGNLEKNKTTEEILMKMTLPALVPGKG